MPKADHLCLFSGQPKFCRVAAGEQSPVATRRQVQTGIEDNFGSGISDTCGVYLWLGFKRMSESGILKQIAETPTALFIVLVSLIGVGGAFAVQRFVAFKKASEDFRGSVLKSLEGLYPNPARWPKGTSEIEHLLRQKFPSLQLAVEQFREALPWWKRRGFDRAWKQYYCSTGREVDGEVYHHYLGFGDTPEPKKVFRKNVSKLLSYARKT